MTRIKEELSIQGFLKMRHKIIELSNKVEYLERLLKKD